jgi:hypothetical protein
VKAAKRRQISNGENGGGGTAYAGSWRHGVTAAMAEMRLNI